MEDLHYAGGLPAVMKELAPLLHTNIKTSWGQTIGDSFAVGRVLQPRRHSHAGSARQSGIGNLGLQGNLCPNGAVMKPSAAGRSLLSHRGRAVVFESIEDLHARIDDPGLDVDAKSVLVLKGCGPKGYPGMPEVGNMPLPRKLLEKGVNDMLRISDARMSGTAFGAVVLHVAPEAAAGGPLALVRDGDEILLDGPNRRLELLISDAELAARAQAWKQKPPPPKYSRGYYQLYVQHVMQADQGCDLDFLVGASGSVVDRESH